MLYFLRDCGGVLFGAEVRTEGTLECVCVCVCVRGDWVRGKVCCVAQNVAVRKREKKRVNIHVCVCVYV